MIKLSHPLFSKLALGSSLVSTETTSNIGAGVARGDVLYFVSDIVFSTMEPIGHSIWFDVYD